MSKSPAYDQSNFFNYNDNAKKMFSEKAKKQMLRKNSNESDKSAMHK